MKVENYKVTGAGVKCVMQNQLTGCAYTQGGTVTIKVLQVDEQVYFKVPTEEMTIDNKKYKAGITDEFLSNGPVVIPAIARADGGKEKITTWVQEANDKYITIGVRNDSGESKTNVIVTYSILTSGHYYAIAKSHTDEQHIEKKEVIDWIEAVKAIGKE